MNKPPIVYGNYEDKYNAKNFISKTLMKSFLRAFDANLNRLPLDDVHTICEIGCGEGELLKRIHAVFSDATFSATDLSPEEIEKARRNTAAFPVDFSIQNAEKLAAYAASSFDLVVCCEVLEHLPDPEQGLRELVRIGKKYILISVPNEPLWRMLNLTRGKYLRDCGNTPGHLNHWTVIQFPKFLAVADLKLTTRNYPLPWQMVLLEKK